MNKFLKQIFRSRAFYCGIVGTLNQLFAFIATKTYYDLERWFSLSGVVCFYGVISVFGLVEISFDFFSFLNFQFRMCFFRFRFAIMTFLLPETENRSLEDIELHFSDNKRSIFSTHIQQNATKDMGTDMKPKDLQQSLGIEAIETNGQTDIKQRV